MSDSESDSDELKMATALLALRGRSFALLSETGPAPSDLPSCRGAMGETMAGIGCGMEPGVPRSASTSSKMRWSWGSRGEGLEEDWERERRRG